MVRRALLCLPLLAAAASPAVYHVAQRHPDASDRNPGTPEAPWKTLSKAAATLRPGDTALIHNGIYREHVRPARGGAPGKPIAYRAADGAKPVITGADLITGWTKVRDGAWTHKPWTHHFATHPNDERHRLIGRCEQAIVDGKLLKQVESPADLAPGTFCADVKAKALYVRLPDGGDPSGHTVEASVRNVCFGHGWGKVTGDHIHVQGLTFRYAANMAQRGALRVKGNHWLVEDCLVEWTNGNGISFRGDDTTFRRVVSRHNGQQGMGGGGRRFLLEEVTFEHNNVKGYAKGWEAGGIKITHARDGVVRRCRALRNDGVGIWFDIDVRDVVVEQCYCAENAGHGIYVEISGGFQIRNNLCVGNGTDDHWAHGGISIAESDHCLIEHNVCVANPTGISIREQGPRTFHGIDRKPVTYHVHHVTIRRNVCALNARYQFGLWSDNVFFGPHPSPNVGSRGIPYDPDASSIRLDHNLYWRTGKQRLALWGCPWRHKHRKYAGLAAWQSDRRQDAASLLADPLFADPAKGDYTLRPASPAHRLRAGPQTRPNAPRSAGRAALPDG